MNNFYKQINVMAKKNLGGRPTVMTQDTLDKLEYAFSIGCTDTEACLYADINPATLYNYQEKNPEFLERKNILKQSPILKAREEVIKGLDKNPEFSLKYLERKKKDEFSLRQEVGIEGDLSVKGIDIKIGD